ncbi:lengsin-like [Clytia hemisphaerica]|uniref:lengsin-like n=1 Tax=Clytia hemisphaerica TaxID=252671 RepID=UPI0034D59AFD
MMVQETHNKTEEEIRKKITEKNIRFVQLEAIDLCGTTKYMLMSSKSFLRNLPDDFHLGVAITNLFLPDGKLVMDGGLTLELGNPNVEVTPDLDTFCVLPWLQDTAGVFCDLDLKGRKIEYLETSCRQQCKKQLVKLEEMGYHLFSSYEYEFYLLHKDTMKPVYEDTNLYSESIGREIRPFIQEVMTVLEQTGIDVEVYTVEDGPAQQEITIKPEFGIKSVDNAIRYKKAVQNIAEKYQMEAIFLSQCFAEEADCSSHFNHSLWDLTKKENAFSDITNDDKLSEVCKYWLAGLQHHSKALSALYWATNNCVERCQTKKEIHFVPVNNSWGFDNRSVCYRIKNYSVRRTYIEDRLPGAGCNPYLVMTGCLIAGMDGIKRKLPLKSEPFVGMMLGVQDLPSGIDKVPESLPEAMKCLEEDSIFCEELGEVFMNAFKPLKKAEFERWQEIENEEERFQMYRGIYGKHL